MGYSSDVIDEAICEVGDKNFDALLDLVMSKAEMIKSKAVKQAISPPLRAPRTARPSRQKPTSQPEPEDRKEAADDTDLFAEMDLEPKRRASVEPRPGRESKPSSASQPGRKRRLSSLTTDYPIERPPPPTARGRRKSESRDSTQPSPMPASAAAPSPSPPLEVKAHQASTQSVEEQSADAPPARDESLPLCLSEAESVEVASSVLAGNGAQEPTEAAVGTDEMGPRVEEPEEEPTAYTILVPESPLSQPAPSPSCDSGVVATVTPTGEGQASPQVIPPSPGVSEQEGGLMQEEDGSWKGDEDAHVEDRIEATAGSKESDDCASRSQESDRGDFDYFLSQHSQLSQGGDFSRRPSGTPTRDPAAPDPRSKDAKVPAVIAVSSDLVDKENTLRMPAKVSSGADRTPLQQVSLQH